MDNELETTHLRDKYIEIFEWCEWKLVLFFPEMFLMILNYY